MNEEQFDELLGRAESNAAHAEIIAAVDLEPGLRLVTRACEEYGQTILHIACRGGHVDLARDLVDRQADVHQRYTGGLDALIFASLNGHIPVMEFLLSRGADVNARSNNGNTALGFAALYDELPACKYLISRGSDLMSKNNEGKTALDIYGYVNSSRLTNERREQHCEELRILFSEGPHPSQVQRRSDVNWGRRWPFMFVVVSCGFRPLPERILEIDLLKEMQRLALITPAELLHAPQQSHTLLLELGRALTTDRSHTQAQTTLMSLLVAMPPPAPPTSLQLSTPEQRRAHWLRVVLCSDFLLRRIVSFL